MNLLLIFFKEQFLNHNHQFSVKVKCAVRTFTICKFHVGFIVQVKTNSNPVISNFMKNEDYKCVLSQKEIYI